MSDRAPSTAATQAGLWMLLAVFLFALMDGGMKWLAADYPPLQIAALRGATALPLVFAWVLLRGRARSLLRVHWRLHLARGALGIAMMAGFVYGLARMPMTTAYAIVFVAPLMVTALAVPLLRERVGPRRWTAIVVGLVGVLVVLRPTGEGVATLAGLVLVGAAFCYSLAAITVRLLAQRDSTEAMVFWFLALLAVGAGALALPGWQPLQRADLAVVAVVGVAGALGQVALTHAFRLGEASQIAPLEYSGLLWVVLLDLTVWQVLPDAMTWVGAAIIVASGLYLLRRERAVSATAPAATSAGEHGS
ncbi:DMT family transporter [Coralloluteibacterium thermophilus]|uniref:DMT family transporter n=1 Tax=Coralloluteibacterium thermophilum TaxID=2707049 RepID=A0ABV9NF09_9GAMM